MNLALVKAVFLFSVTAIASEKEVCINTILDGMPVYCCQVQEPILNEKLNEPQFVLPAVAEDDNHHNRQGGIYGKSQSDQGLPPQKFYSSNPEVIYFLRTQVGQFQKTEGIIHRFPGPNQPLNLCVPLEEAPGETVFVHDRNPPDPSFLEPL